MWAAVLTWAQCTMFWTEVPAGQCVVYTGVRVWGEKRERKHYGYLLALNTFLAQKKYKTMPKCFLALDKKQVHLEQHTMFRFFSSKPHKRKNMFPHNTLIGLLLQKWVAKNLMSSFWGKKFLFPNNFWELKKNIDSVGHLKGVPCVNDAYKCAKVDLQCSYSPRWQTQGGCSVCP